MTARLDFGRVERMTSALNASFVALSRDGECRSAYSAAGISHYTEAEHDMACDEAMADRMMRVAQVGIEEVARGQ